MAIGGCAYYSMPDIVAASCSFGRASEESHSLRGKEDE
jgi:hypothetical protein